MAEKPFHQVAGRVKGTLDATINAAATSAIFVPDASSGPLPSAPFKPVFGPGPNQEIIRVGSVALDTPSAGKHTLNGLTRAQDGTSATTHTAGAAIHLYVLPSAMTEIHDAISDIRKLVRDVIGGSPDNVITYGTTRNQLMVVENAPPDMGFTVKAGRAYVNDHPVDLSADFANPLLVAPSTDPRIDIVTLDQDGTVAVVTGTEAPSPSAPATPADTIKLAEITLQITTTTITDATEIADTRPQF